MGVRIFARMVSWVLSPLLIPTYTTLILLYSGFHFSMYTWPAKRMLLVVVFVATGILPALTLLISEFGKKWIPSAPGMTDNRVAMVFIGLYYYLGFYLLSKMPLFNLFKIILLAGTLLVIIFIVLSLYRRISLHMAALGSALGAVTAIAVRLNANPVALMLAIVLVSGLVGSSLLLLRKHTLTETLVGFPLGFVHFFLLLYIL